MAGKLIVLEGIDGSGKSTQYAMLCRRFEREGRPFRHIVFPRYREESSSLIRMYLTGQFGPRPTDVNAYTASTFFAVDRYASFKTDWGDYYSGGGLVLSDRYTTSNAVHQGSKVPPQELDSFLDWLYDFEFRILELPRPDIVIYLDIDVNTSFRQMARRQRETNTQGDIHETDREYLLRCAETGRRACGHYGWRRIQCDDQGSMRDADSIHREIYDYIMEVI